LLLIFFGATVLCLCKVTARYVNVCRAHKPLEEYMIQKWSCPKDIELHGNDFAKSGFKTIEDAKAYAKAAYKQRIKQALGL